jgi:hypothetical protein
MPHSLVDKILPILSAVKDDKEKLQRILHFLEAEILPELEEEDDSIAIPPKYETLVRDIAQNISCGLICHLNIDTLETEEYPQSSEMDFWEDDEEGEGGDGDAPKYLQWENVISFEPLDSSESFRIMENFARQLDNTKAQNSLLDILNGRKPFAHFNSYIHNSTFREAWFAFKNNAYEKHVRAIIYVTLNEQE